MTLPLFPLAPMCAYRGEEVGITYVKDLTAATGSSGLTGSDHYVDDRHCCVLGIAGSDARHVPCACGSVRPHPRRPCERTALGARDCVNSRAESARPLRSGSGILKEKEKGKCREDMRPAAGRDGGPGGAGVGET